MKNVSYFHLFISLEWGLIRFAWKPAPSIEGYFFVYLHVIEWTIRHPFKLTLLNYESWVK